MAKGKTRKQEEAPARREREMTEKQLLAIVDNEIKNSLGMTGSKLSNDRMEAMSYYYGERTGRLAPPESEGRSTVVSMEVADTIEWIMPSLIRIFTSGDDAVEFSPTQPGDEPAAQQATEWANYVFYAQNDGFLIIHDWFKDALLQKLGVVKTWWDASKDVTTEEYEGLTLEELTLMMQDGQVEVIQQTARLPEDSAESMPITPVYDVKVKRTRNTGHSCVENVPPEEFLVSRKARSAKRMPSCHHRLERTVSELRERGYKNVELLTDDDCGAEFSQESEVRNSDTDEYGGDIGGESSDESMRAVWITESYLQVDWNNDGIAEWRKVVKSGKVLLENDEIDEHPFSMLTPVKMPHKLIGRSVADLVMELQEIKTSLLRQFIDNMYLQNNPRNYVDMSKGVNIDDLLDSRVGGIVRGKGENGVTPILTQPLSPMTFNLLEYIDRMKEGRTGVNSTFQGMNADSLNKTATGVNALVSAAQSRIELIARVFAETGVKDLFRKILKLSAQYQQKEQIIRLRDTFVAIDPRAWKTQYDMKVNVGLGNGNKDQIAAHLTNILGIQKEAMAGGLPIVGAKQIYNAASKLAVNLGFKSGEDFFVDPESPEGQQMQQAAAQRPDPKMAEVQAKAQAEQQKLGIEAQKSQMQAQADERKAAMDMELERYRIDKQAEIDLLKHQMSMQAEFQKAQLNAAVEAARHEPQPQQV